jgi:hypothetical protein
LAVTLICHCLNVTQNHAFFSTQSLFPEKEVRDSTPDTKSAPSHASSSFFWTARYERFPFASLISLRRP